MTSNANSESPLHPLPPALNLGRVDGNFIKITLADFIVRSAYQVGKTPLLPIFAAALGASDVLLGTIVSVSTMTGMVTKPLFGLLSDRLGRRLWILIGTALFAGVPFLYRFVETPGQLVLLRLIHGTATAIYGPVTVAYVAERSGKRKAERLGWFGMARSGGYIVGPALGGWLLLWMDPASVFTVIGLISAAAFVPVLLLDETKGRRGGEVTRGRGDEATGRRGAETAGWPGGVGTMQEASRTTDYAPRTPHHALRLIFLPAIWLSGGMEAVVYLATYAIKAFLPVYALTAGYSTAQIGLFFSVQEFAQILLKPAGGRLGDHMGHLRAVGFGILGLAVLLPALPLARSVLTLLSIAVVMGAAQAVVFPATLALIADQARQGQLATGVGLAGTLKNAGKVAGPVLGGLLIAWLGYQGMFWLLCGVLGLGAGIVLYTSRGQTGVKVA